MTEANRPSAAPLRIIAVDAMGGDHAPRETVLGALEAARQFSVRILLVGRKEDIQREIDSHGGGTPENIEIIDAREVVEMNEPASTPLRKKRDSSVRVCADLVRDGRAQAFVSAGNTGAAGSVAKVVMGTIEGVSRPALAAVFPSQKGHTLVLDVGSIVDAKPNHLREFAVMGHFYSQMIFGVERPRVGLLSIGEEEGKGNELTKGVFGVLGSTGLNFIGNAEGRDIFNGNADVIVCDGFTGNVVLKAAEALGEMVNKHLREELMQNPIRKFGAFLARGAFSGLRRRMDYSEYGGAPLLGVNGGCIICHGRSNSKAIRNAIRVAADFAENEIHIAIRERIGQLHANEATLSEP